MKPDPITSENGARMAGFTRPLEATCVADTLFLLAKPHADLDGTFAAFDRDECEMIRVKGWMASIKEGED